MSSIKQIAAELGLSVATVSRALDPSCCDKVRESTRKRIQDFCEKVNYRPNASGRSCATGRTYKIGFISGAPLLDYSSIHAGRYFISACNELQRRGYAALVLCATGDDLDNSVVNFLRSKVADAYVIGQSLLTQKVMEAIKHTASKVVAPNAYGLTANASSIERDFFPAFREIWSHVPKIWSDSVIFCGPNNSNTREKYQAAYDTKPQGMTLKLKLLPNGNQYNEFTRYLSFRWGQQKMDFLRKQHLIWCSSDLVALGICDAMQEAGIRVGRDVSVVGFDNLESIVSASSPFLSTVDSLQEEHGRLSVSLALDLLENHPLRHIKIPLKYIPRKSF